MKSRSSAVLVLVFLLGFVAIPAGFAAERTAGEVDPLVVHLDDGRTFTGDLDPQTDAEHLALVFRRGAITVLRPIEWAAVLRVSFHGQESSGEEFRRVAEKIGQQAPVAKPPAVTRLTLIGREPDPAPIASAPAKAAEAPVRYMTIDAALGGWSDTVEADGLVVYVQAFDAVGRRVPVHGTLEVDLTGWRNGVAAPSQPFFNLARWSQTVRPEDFCPRGAVYRFAFQAVDPQHDLNVASKGVVHASLSVPGQGTFEATQTDVRIRPFSARRDALQATTGQRFLPQERTRNGQ